MGEVVTGLKGRPSSVAVELHYNGQPYEELLANSMVEEEYKKVGPFLRLSSYTSDI